MPPKDLSGVLGSKYVVVLALALLEQPAHAQLSQAGVSWRLRVYDMLGEHAINVASSGGTLPNTGLTTCVQNPIRDFNDASGNRQQEIRITCSVGISAKVTLIQSCFANQVDRSFGAMKVDDGLSTFTVSLACNR